MKKIAILADSGCQLPIGTLENQGIYIVPLTITMNNKAYLDFEEISALDVFERMNETGEIIKTSQPSTGVIQAAVKRIINNGYDHIPCQYLVNSIESRDTFERCVSWNFDISFNISYSNSQEWIDRYHEAGIDVACYTFNQYTSIETLQEWIDKGVDFVTCDVLTQNDIILPDREWINTLPTYKVIFKDIDGNILKEAIVREGYNAVAPFNPVKEGYEFIGWDQEFTNVTKDIVVNALYHIKTYKICLLYTSDAADD